MKAVTHNLFAAGVGLCFISRLGYASPPFVTLALWLAIAVNTLIDVLGHRSRGGTPVRSFLTHSVFTAPLWGALVAALSVYVLGIITSQVASKNTVTLALGMGVLIAYSHLLLDCPTEGGIYLLRRRMALAHLRYDNGVLNITFAAIGVLLLLASFY